MAEGAGSRILSGFANVLLERGMPRIEAWLRDRLGSAAALRAMRVEAGQAHLEGVCLPFGGATLHVQHASLALEATPTPRARLVRLDGVLSAQHGELRFEAPIELAATRNDDREAWVDGTLSVKGATWTQRRGEGAAEPLHGTVEVRVTLKRWALRRGQLAGTVAEVWLDAEGAMDNSEGRGLDVAHLTFKHARAGHLVDALDALSAADLPSGASWPWTALLTGELAWERSGRIVAKTSVADPGGGLPEGLRFEADFDRRDDRFVGSLDVVTTSSSLRAAPLSVHDDEQLAGSVEGSVSLADLQRLGTLGSRALIVEGLLGGQLGLAGTMSQPRVDGHVYGDKLHLRGRPGVPPMELRNARAVARITRDELTLREITAIGWGGEVGGELCVAIGREQTQPALRARLVDVHGSLLEDLGQLPRGLQRRLAMACDGRRPADELWLSRDTRITGEFEVSASLATRGSFALETRDSAIIVELVIDDAQRLAGSKLSGRVGVADALLLGLFDTPIKPLPEGSAQLEALLEGTLSAPVLRGKVRTGHVRIDGAGAVVLDCQELRTTFVWDQEAFVWRDLVAGAYGGLIHGEGLIGFTEAFDGSDTDIVVSELAVAELPLDRHEARLGAYLTGQAHLKLHLDQRRRDDPVTGRGTLTVEPVAYPVVDLATARLREVGLPPPPKQGARPLTCAFLLEADAVLIESLAGGVDGCGLDGRGRVHFAGHLDGSATLRLERDYLRKSALLTLPALATGDLKVPVRVGGTVSKPRIDTNVAAAIRDGVSDGALGSAVSGAARGVASAVDGVFTAVDDLLGSVVGSRETPRNDAELEALVERIMNDDPDTDRLIDALIDAGVSSEDIVRILERRRMRF